MRPLGLLPWLLLPALACAGTGGPTRVSVRPEHRGTYVLKADMSAGGSLFRDRNIFELVQSTTEIPCKPGQLFGTLLQVRLASAGSLPAFRPSGGLRGGRAQVQVGGGSHLRALPLEVRWEHPPLLDLETGRTTTVTAKTRTVGASDLSGYPYFFGWRLSKGRRADGPWRLVLSYQGKVLREERFAVSGCEVQSGSASDPGRRISPR